MYFSLIEKNFWTLSKLRYHILLLLSSYVLLCSVLCSWLLLLLPLKSSKTIATTTEIPTVRLAGKISELPLPKQWSWETFMLLWCKEAAPPILDFHLLPLLHALFLSSLLKITLFLHLWVWISYFFSSNAWFIRSILRVYVLGIYTPRFFLKYKHLFRLMILIISNSRMSPSCVAVIIFSIYLFSFHTLIDWKVNAPHGNKDYTIYIYVGFT